MKKNSRDNRPAIEPVTHIELHERNLKPRGILAIAFLVIGMGFLWYALTSSLSTEPTWQRVEIASNQPNCSSDFVLMYDFSEAGNEATAQYKRLANVYKEASEQAFRIFSPDVLEDGLGNVAYLNAHVNEAVAVEEVLYRALELVTKYADRHVFLAPAAAEYNNVFLSESDGDAALYDPGRNADTAAWLKELSGYVQDPEMISLELLGENQVRLRVSDDYLQFAQEWKIETFLDFGWMTNAFLADYLADILVSNGFTYGYLSSYDGFVRNLDTRGQTYFLNFFDRQGKKIYSPAQMRYTAPASIVFLRDYPMAEEDWWHYYVYESGETVTAFLDPADGMSKSAVDSLMTYSANAGCAEILLQTAPVFIADDFQREVLSGLAREGVYAIWCEGEILKYNDAALSIELLTDKDGKQYTSSFEK